MLYYENKLTFRIYVSDKKFENSMGLLLVIDEDKPQYVCIKHFVFHRTNNKNKKYFSNSWLQCFSSKNVLTKHKEVCLSINGAKTVRLEKGTTEFKKYFKQIPIPFNIYANFKCNLKSVESFTQKSMKITFLVVLLTSLFVLMINLLSR